TEIRKENGKCAIRKEAAFPESVGHIRSLPQKGEALRRQYAGSKLTVCPCVEIESAVAVESPFVSGRTLEEIADEGIETGRYEQTEAVIRELIALIREKNADRPFQMTEAFTEVFGPAEFTGTMHAGGVSDIDMVLGNILVNADAAWTLIDYEWTFDFPVPTEFLIYRMLHYYFETAQSRHVLKDREYLQLSKADEQTFRQMEIHFQQYINGTHVPIHELYPVMGKPAVDMRAVMAAGEIPPADASRLGFGDRGNASLLRRAARKLKKSLKEMQR
ncbi:MAG: hypothetical protein LUH53_10005, partial [Lachnospiraceae bacterium]|nr:hypothetical protein [Lachnospiraceae bacterium]